MDGFKNDDLAKEKNVTKLITQSVYIPEFGGDDEIEFAEIYNATCDSDYIFFEKLSNFFRNNIDFNINTFYCQQLLNRAFYTLQEEKDVRSFDVLWVIVHLMILDSSLWCDITEIQMDILIDFIDIEAPPNIVSQVIFIFDIIAKNDQFIPASAKSKLMEYLQMSIEQQHEIIIKLMDLLVLLLLRESEPSDIVIDFVDLSFILINSSNPDMQFKSLESIYKITKVFEGFVITDEQANIILNASETKNVGIVERALSIISSLITNGDCAAAFLACDGIKRLSEIPLIMYPKIAKLIATIFEHASNVSSDICAICVSHTSQETISDLPFIAKFPMLRFLAIAVQRSCVTPDSPLYDTFLNSFLDDYDSLNSETIELCLNAFYFAGVSGVGDLEEKLIEALSNLSEDEENYAIIAEKILKFIKDNHIEQ